MTQRIAFQGEPGAYSHQACHTARPHLEALPCPTFEAVIEAVASGAAEQAMLPVEKHHLRARGRYPPAPAAIGPAHRRRGLRAGAHQPSRRARRDDRRCEGGLVAPRPAAAMRALPARKRHRGPGQHRQRPRRARRGRAGGQDAGGARIGTRGRDLRAGRAGAPYRGSRQQHDALSDHGAGTGHDPPGRSHDDDLRLPRAQHPRRALQGHGRLRHERREHDQAGKLHDRRLLHRDAVLCRHRKATPTTGTCNWRWKSWSTSPAISRFWAPTPPTPRAIDTRSGRRGKKKTLRAAFSWGNVAAGKGQHGRRQHDLLRYRPR